MPLSRGSAAPTAGMSWMNKVKGMPKPCPKRTGFLLSGPLSMPAWSRRIFHLSNQTAAENRKKTISRRPFFKTFFSGPGPVKEKSALWVRSNPSLATPNPIQLDDQQYLMLGDNSRQSRDSRYFGPVATDSVKGVVGCIYWPPERWRQFGSPLAGGGD